MQRINRRVRFGVLGSLAALAVAVTAVAGSAATTTVVVTQNSSSWSTMDTRPGGAVDFTEAYDAPAGLGSGSLELTTDATTDAKADYWTRDSAGTLLADVNELSYWTFQAATPQPPHAAVSYQLQIDANGAATGGFTTLVFEPYQNGVIVPATWQQWDVDAGNLWSSRSFTDGTCVLVAGAGGAPFYSLATLKTLCPDAVVLGIGVNIGTFNPGYTVATDGVQFNDVIYNFEVGLTPATKDDCKNGGWMTFNDPAFKNQGECVSWVNQRDAA
ncbi:MAG TPA: hypothetical protein VNP93_15540 [Gaiellaceae bacterium]|nr:hypothetical protein [Gaiellaceae bacterium]